MADEFGLDDKPQEYRFNTRFLVRDMQGELRLRRIILAVAAISLVGALLIYLAVAESGPAELPAGVTAAAAGSAAAPVDGSSAAPGR